MKAWPLMASRAARSRQSRAVSGSVWFMCGYAVSESRWRAGRDDLARLVARVAETVRDGAGEIVGVARAQLAGLGAHGEFDAAADDHSALLALVPQHVGTGVGARGVALVQDRHRAVWPPCRHQA